MSKYKVGDKFVFEITDIHVGNKFPYDVGCKKTGITVDDKFLSQIPRFDNESSYNKGMEDAFALMKRICNMEVKEFDEIFGEMMFSELFDYDNIGKIKDKVEKHDEMMKITVGTVVKEGGGMKGVITKVSKTSVSILWANGDLSYRTMDYARDNLIKTGSHIPIQALLDQMAAKDD